MWCVFSRRICRQRKNHTSYCSVHLALDAETLIDSYALRFQIEFNFRDAKQLGVRGKCQQDSRQQRRESFVHGQCV